MLKKSRLILIASVLVITVITPAWGSSKPFFWVIDDFSKGQNSHISEYKTPKNYAQSATNVRTNVRYGKLSKREPLLTHFDAGAAAVNSLYRYYNSDGTTAAIAANSTLLVIGDASSTQTIQDGLTDGARWQWITFKDIAIGTNGYEQPYKYDGKTQITANTDASRTATEVCAQLGAPFAELNTGTNLDASKWYQYKIAFYDGSNYTHSTAVSNPILTGAAVYDILLTDIPIGPTGTTNRYLYRTSGIATQGGLGAATYYMVYDIANNTARTQADTISDGTLETDRAPTWATGSGGTSATPPKGTLIALLQDRVFISGNLTNLSDIYWSDDSNPDYFSATTYDVIRADDGDKITFMMPENGIMVLGKTNTLQHYYTDDSTTSNWYSSNVMSHIGCPAPYSVASTPKGIAYLSRKGLRIYNGATSQLFSDAITPEIRDIDPGDIANTAGVFFDEEYRLAYRSSSSGSSVNDREAIYNFVRDSFVIDTKNVNCYSVFNSGTDLGTLYAGSSTTDGYVLAHAGSTSAVQARYKSEFADGTHTESEAYRTELAPELSMETLERMETYTTEALAQAAWVSDDASATADVLDEDCTGISDWDDDDSGGGVSAVASTEYFQFTTSGSSGHIAKRSLTSVPTIPLWYTLSFELNITGDGNGGDVDNVSVVVKNGTSIFSVFFTDGKARIASASVGEILATYTEGVEYLWKFDVREDGSGDYYVDTYKDGVLQTTGVTVPLSAATKDIAIEVRGYNQAVVCLFDTFAIASKNLQCYNESTIVNEGDQSLQCEAMTTGSLNNVFIKTITATDLSATTHDTIVVDVYSNRTGTNLQFGIKENDTTWATNADFVNIPITAANTWERVALDFSGVADGSKDAITHIGVKVTNADAGNIFYIDKIRPSSLTATYVSPVYEITATDLDKLYWNENLGAYGDITFQIRQGATSGALGAYETAVTTPTGSDLSGITANNFLQIKINLTSANGSYAPYLYKASNYVYRLTYSKVGDAYESTILSTWDTGWTNLGAEGYKKLLQRIKVHYRGTSGTLKINYYNEEDDVDETIEIDLSVAPDDSDTDLYTGVGEDKIYTYDPPGNSEETPGATGEYWRFVISEDGIISWDISKIQIQAVAEELY